jgi:hypothetical protein
MYIKDGGVRFPRTAIVDLNFDYFREIPRLFPEVEGPTRDS